MLRIWSQPKFGSLFGAGAPSPVADHPSQARPQLAVALVGRSPLRLMTIVYQPFASVGIC
jgi:hypothetical protein